MIRGTLDELLAAGYAPLTIKEFKQKAEQLIPIAHEILKRDGHSYSIDEVRLHFHRWWYPLYLRKKEG